MIYFKNNVIQSAREYKRIYSICFTPIYSPYFTEHSVTSKTLYRYHFFLLLGKEWLIMHQMETLSALLAISAGNSPVTGEFPHKGQSRGALVFSLICVWIKGWVNNREAGDLIRHRAYHDVIVTYGNDRQARNQNRLYKNMHFSMETLIFNMTVSQSLLTMMFMETTY